MELILAAATFVQRPPPPSLPPSPPPQSCSACLQSLAQPDPTTLLRSPAHRHGRMLTLTLPAFGQRPPWHDD